MADKVKLLRSPIDTNCNDCDIRIPFGVFCYFNEENGTAVCIDCGVEHGWADKERVKRLIKKKEIQLDIKSLRRVREMEARSLANIKQKVKVFTLAEKHVALEQDYLNLRKEVEAYLHQCGTPKEKEAFKKLFELVEKMLATQKSIEKELYDQLYLLDKEELRDKEKEKKRKEKVAAKQRE